MSRICRSEDGQKDEVARFKRSGELKEKKKGHVGKIDVRAARVHEIAQSREL